MSEWPVDRELDEQLRRVVAAELAAADHRQIDVRSGRTRPSRSVVGIALAVAASVALVAALAWRAQVVPIAASPGATPVPTATADASATPAASPISGLPDPTQNTPTGLVPSPTPTPTLTPTLPGTIAEGTHKIFPCSYDGGFVVALADGRVLVAGMECAAIFDPVTHTFHVTGSMREARGAATATLLRDGRVLVTGGGRPSGEIYDPKTGKFTIIAPLAAHGASAAANLKDGRVLIVGADINPPAAGAEILDPKTGKVAPAGPLAAGLAVPAAVTLDDGRVLVADTFESNEVYTQLYDPATNTFRATRGQQSRGFACAAPLPNGKVMVLADGGTEAAAYDPSSDTFHPLAAPSTWPVQVLRCTKLSDGRILAIGEPVGEGSGAATGLRSAGAHFDRPLAPSPAPRAEYATEPINIAALIYDPAADRWAYLGRLVLQRLTQSVGLAPLPNGGALIVGDEPGGSTGVTPELFDPKTNTFLVNE